MPSAGLQGCAGFLMLGNERFGWLTWVTGYACALGTQTPCTGFFFFVFRCAALGQLRLSVDSLGDGYACGRAYGLPSRVRSFGGAAPHDASGFYMGDGSLRPGTRAPLAKVRSLGQFPLHAGGWATGWGGRASDWFGRWCQDGLWTAFALPAERPVAAAAPGFVTRGRAYPGINGRSRRRGRRQRDRGAHPAGDRGLIAAPQAGQGGPGVLAHRRASGWSANHVGFCPPHARGGSACSRSALVLLARACLAAGRWVVKHGQGCPGSRGRLRSAGLAVPYALLAGCARAGSRSSLGRPVVDEAC